MSDTTADLWERAGDCDDEPSEIEAELADLNRELDWDRRALLSSVDGVESD